MKKTVLLPLKVYIHFFKSNVHEIIFSRWMERYFGRFGRMSERMRVCLTVNMTKQFYLVCTKILGAIAVTQHQRQCWHIGLGITLKSFKMKIFLCDGQGAVRRAILYVGLVNSTLTSLGKSAIVKLQ